jgi:glycosyltransferase involved in cell wall biosynthesis
MKEMNNKKLAIIGTVGVPARYGGFETLAHQLVEHLSARHDITVYCSSTSYTSKERIRYYKGARLVYLPLSANGLSSIFYDLLSIIHALFTSQVLLVLGVSAGIFFPLIKKISDKPIIVNIDGLEWRRSKWNKWARRYLRYAEKMAVQAADMVVADNQAIADYVEEVYGKQAFMIPYGGDHTFPVKASQADFEKFPFMEKPYAFKVCRIEPENNIEMILKAFIQFEGYPLVLVGNWQHSAYGKRLWDNFQQYENLILLDPIYDPQVINSLRCNCRLYVHGHAAGGTNPSLVEAMSLGLPVLAKDVIYNRFSTAYEAFFFEDQSDLLIQLKQLTDWQLDRKGLQMKEIANRLYRWEDIANAYESCFETENQNEETYQVNNADDRIVPLWPTRQA